MTYQTYERNGEFGYIVTDADGMIVNDERDWNLYELREDAQAVGLASVQRHEYEVWKKTAVGPRAEDREYAE